jgi:quinol monooxygenase YgiN
MGRFIQVIEFESSRYDEMQGLLKEVQARSSESGTGPVRATAAQDRDRPGHYVHLVEFESYETAMANSNDPATQEFAARMAELTDGAPKFYNLDVSDIWEP